MVVPPRRWYSVGAGAGVVGIGSSSSFLQPVKAVPNSVAKSAAFITVFMVVGFGNVGSSCQFNRPAIQRPSLSCVPPLAMAGHPVAAASAVTTKRSQGAVERSLTMLNTAF